MGEAYILRRGGSGGLSPNSAVIHVNAPTGSTITLTKGGITVKTIGPEKSHINSEYADYADWYIPISASNYGEWTVTATLGNDTASKTVTINDNKTYDVLLTFHIFVIRNGTLQSGYTLYPGELKLEQRPEFVYLAYKNGSSGSAGGIGTLGEIDYPYMVLKASAGLTSNDGANSYGITTEPYKTSNSHSAIKAQFGAYSFDTTPKTWVLDVSQVNLNGKYIFLSVYGSGRYLNITDLYFAKEAPTV